MNWVDIVILAIISISALMSLSRGLYKELMSLVIWVVAFLVAINFQDGLSVLLEQSIPHLTLRTAASYVILFISTLILGSVVNFFVAQLFKATGLSSTDKALGVVFGLLRGAMIVMAILIFFPMVLPVNKELWWQQSLLIPEFLALEDSVKSISKACYDWITSFLGHSK